MEGSIDTKRLVARLVDLANRLDKSNLIYETSRIDALIYDIQR
jgi:hypothetical protein